MIKAVIFDLDDTLIKTSETKYEALKFAANHFYKLELTTEMIKTHWGKPFRKFMINLFGEIDTIESIIQNYYSVRNQFPSPAYEDAVNTLGQLAKKYILGVVTASTRHIAEEDLQAAGFNLSLFTYIQTSEQTSVHKPDPKVFEPVSHMLLEKNIFPNNVVYVGDSLADYEAAHGSGFHFVGITGRTTTHTEFKNIIFAIDHFSKLFGIIKSIK